MGVEFGGQIWESNLGVKCGSQICESNLGVEFGKMRQNALFPTTYETKEFKQAVMIKRPYECGIAVYQLDKYFSRQDFELCYMDTDSFNLAISGDSLDDIVRPEMKKVYEADKKN